MKSQPKHRYLWRSENQLACMLCPDDHFITFMDPGRRDATLAVLAERGEMGATEPGGERSNEAWGLC